MDSPIFDLSNHRRAFSDCWIALLALPMKPQIYKRILHIMHRKIIPYLTRPARLHVFLSDSYNLGGSISLLALNGLFTLINEHNL